MPTQDPAAHANRRRINAVHATRKMGMRKRTRNIIGIIIIIGVLAFLISSSVIDSYKYYYTVDEVLKKSDELAGKDIKMAGSVKDKSIIMKKSEAGCSFVLSGDSGEMAVDYKGQVPDTFKNNIPVVVEGRFYPDKGMKAVSLLTKCASKYEEKVKN